MKRYILFFLVVVGFLSQAQTSSVSAMFDADFLSATAAIDSSASKIKVVADPATGIVMIDMGGEIVQELSIVNAQGQEVFRQVVGGAKSLNLNLKFLKKGIYFIVFDGTIGTKMKQLIVD